MNLVAKEYVASRPTAGAIVLSEFAGAALSMSSAYLINPHDVQQMKEALARRSMWRLANASDDGAPFAMESPPGRTTIGPTPSCSHWRRRRREDDSVPTRLTTRPVVR